ncbi:hypothetical protein [Kangiella aquimarina]|uniref:Gluconate 2-dehydrogenase subunit 3 family protein n=1 Tax=Kangiella aquimarina TaxID=261965 RepID=A0ABZ0X677_9GAMM|nr:hypothetical protein [Kangiella aquimarina]WQG86014.1 hypothetical protein SR900_03780 [Kangiella aquimarina]
MKKESGDKSIQSTARRKILKGALWGSFAIASGVSLWQLSLTESVEVVEADQYPYRFLTLDERLLLWAIIPAYLYPALDKDDEASRFLVLRNIDGAISGLPQSTQDELRQLFSLLSFQLSKALVAGIWTRWNQADIDSLQSFLSSWRESYVALLRVGYLGLHQIIVGSFYGEPISWQNIGYPGPPQMNLPESFYEDL